MYITVPKSKPSPFVIEISEKLNVEFKDDVIEQYMQKFDTYKCPICGSLLKREHVYGLEGFVYRCSQEKEICDFMTNELKYKLSIDKCNLCEDGYLVFKTVSTNKSLMKGCTNYKEDGTGCNHTIFIRQE